MQLEGDVLEVFLPFSCGTLLAKELVPLFWAVFLAGDGSNTSGKLRNCLKSL